MAANFSKGPDQRKGPILGVLAKGQIRRMKVRWVSGKVVKIWKRSKLGYMEIKFRMKTKKITAI